MRIRIIIIFNADPDPEPAFTSMRIKLPRIMRIWIRKPVLNKTYLINLADVQLSWDKVHHRLTKSLMDVIKVASSRRRNVILDQVRNIYGTVK
jgi:hypothetical protein